MPRWLAYLVALLVILAVLYLLGVRLDLNVNGS